MSYYCKHLVFGISVSLPLVVGCRAELVDTDAVASEHYTHAQPLEAPAPAFEGLVHRFGRSRFELGGDQKTVLADGYEKVVGNLGVFALEIDTGLTMALPNAGSGRELAEPYSANPEECRQAGVKYFIESGIPETQIRGSHVTTLIRDNGTASDGRDNPPKFVAYNSVLERHIEGIDIPDSVAWVRLAKDGSVVAETVYWPPIDRDAIRNAKALSARWSDRGLRAQILGRANQHAEIVESTVKTVVHHTPLGERAPIRAYAVFDAAGRT